MPLTKTEQQFMQPMWELKKYFLKKISFITALLLVSVALAFGQKLPKMQTSSIRAANIKIDGKTTEWDDQFQAHNQPNRMYYTLSNDDNNLYLTAQMDDIAGSKKIFKGGLTFTITPFDKKTNKISVTFPVISKEKRVRMEDGGDRRLIDSLSSFSNNVIMNNYKEIHITGIPEINSPLLSIYNTNGIKVGASFDKKMRYTYELAIPLKYLESAITNLKSIRYNIKVNAEPIDAVRRVPTSGISIIDPNARPFTIDELFNLVASDFSGVYTLALKP